MKIIYIAPTVVITIALFIILSYRHLKKEYLQIQTPDVFKVDLSLQNREYFRDKRVLICGLARDIKNNLYCLRQNLKTISGVFKDYLVIIVENDSEDGSRDELLDLKKEFKMILLGCGIDAPKCEMKSRKYGHDHDKSRIEKMINLRNIYMDYINRISPGEYDFVVMYDFDILGCIYEDGLLDSAYYFQKFPEINMMASNSVLITPLNLFFNIYYYYDQYAIVPSRKFIKIKDRPVGDKTDLVEVESAFGGLVIYRFDSLYGLKYRYENDDKGVPLCEHVVLHKKVVNKFLNPRMIFSIIKN